MREMQASSQVVPKGVVSRDQFSKVKWTGAIVQVLLALRLELRNNSSCAGQRRLSMASGRSLVSIPRSAGREMMCSRLYVSLDAHWAILYRDYIGTCC